MSLRDTSEAVNDAINVIREEIARLRAASATGHLEDDEFARLLSLTQSLSEIENNRGQLLLGALAGRRGLDKLPPHELERVVQAIAGVQVPVEQAPEVKPMEPKEKK